MTETTPETARLTADVVLLCDDHCELYVLVIRRGWPPYEGCWALPGGHVDAGEQIDLAARRELTEETGLTADRLTFIGAYAEPGRDPRGRYVTFAYMSCVSGLPQPTAGDDAVEARWMPVYDLLAGSAPLAFDHGRIIHDALHRAV
jgi:8-oxo-dGTP diphosphatase